MRWHFRLLLAFLLFALLATTTLSCARLAENDFPSHEMRYFDDTPVGQSRAYKEYKTLVPGEKARISYLLWRMEYSNLYFWRNGSTYAGRDGAGWLRWKMRKFYPDVKTAGEFISQVASQSEKSRQRYRVSCPQHGDFHDLFAVLASELLALDVYERSQESVAVGSYSEQPAATLPQEEKLITPQAQEPPQINQTSPAGQFPSFEPPKAEELKDSGEGVPTEEPAV